MISKRQFLLIISYKRLFYRRSMKHGPPLSILWFLPLFEKSGWKDAERYDKIDKMGEVCPDEIEGEFE